MTKRIVNIAIYMGSLTDQQTIWVGAKTLIIEALKNEPYDLKFWEIKSEDIHRVGAIYNSGNGPVPSRATIKESEFVSKFREADIHLFVDHFRFLTF
jgi:hypothetical protein